MTTHNSQYSAETTHPDKQERNKRICLLLPSFSIFFFDSLYALPCCMKDKQQQKPCDKSDQGSPKPKHQSTGSCQLDIPTTDTACCYPDHQKRQCHQES